MINTFRPRRQVLLLVALLALCLPAAARIITPGDAPSATIAGGHTVVLADGWELAEVTVTWHADEGLLVVERADGARRVLRPEDLAGVRDATGRDVTAELLPRWAVDRLGGTMPPAAPVVQPQPEPRRKPQPAPAPLPTPKPVDEDADQPRVPRAMRDFAAAGAPDPLASAPGLDPRVIFSLGLGYSAPQDGHFGGYDGGLGFEGTLRIQLGGPLYLSGGYLYQTLKNPGYMDIYYDMPPYEGDWGSPYYYYAGDEGRLWGPWAGLSLISTAETGRPVRFYLEGGVGRFDVEGLPLWSYDSAYLGYRLATGFMIPVGEMAAFNLGCRALHLPNLDFGWAPDDGHTMLGVEMGLSILSF